MAGRRVAISKFKHWWTVVLLTAGIALNGQAAWAQDAGTETQNLAPDFVLRAVAGGNIRLSEFQGQVVVLGFWARWCGDCRQARQALDSLYGKYQRAGLVMLGIDVDDSMEQTRAMARSLGLTFPVLVDEQKTVSNLYKVKSMPLIILIDRAGQIRYQHKGFQLGDQAKISDEFRQLLNE